MAFNRKRKDKPPPKKSFTHLLAGKKNAVKASRLKVHINNQKGVRICCDIPSICPPRQPGRRFPPANTQQIHLLFISYMAEKLARPDKAIYPPPAQPVQTLSLMFSLLQEINMFGSRQTTQLCQAGSSRLAGHHWGP